MRHVDRDVQGQRVREILILGRSLPHSFGLSQRRSVAVRRAAGHLQVID